MKRTRPYRWRRYRAREAKRKEYRQLYIRNKLRAAIKIFNELCMEQEFNDPLLMPPNSFSACQ